MTIYTLVFVAFLNHQPTEPLVGLFTDKTKCEIAYGLLLDTAAKNVDITGWSTPAMCVPTAEELKS